MCQTIYCCVLLTGAMQKVLARCRLVTDETYGGADTGACREAVSIQLPVLGLFVLCLSVLPFPLRKP